MNASKHSSQWLSIAAAKICIPNNRTFIIDWITAVKENERGVQPLVAVTVVAFDDWRVQAVFCVISE